jgi:hypothetical protein
VTGIDGLPTLSTDYENKIRSLDVPDVDEHESLSGPSQLGSGGVT